jgi:hypothetical protein
MCKIMQRKGGMRDLIEWERRGIHMSMMGRGVDAQDTWGGRICRSDRLGKLVSEV